MTALPATQNQRLADVLAATGPVLLDFDGPVTPLYVGGRNRLLSDRIRALVTEAGHQLTDDVANTVDPLALLRWSATHLPDNLADSIESLSTSGEVEFARQSDPTPGAHELLSACREAGRPVVIVSNNAAEPIRAYLDRFDLTGLVVDVIGRRHRRPDLMKPHPDSVHRALSLLHEPAQRCAFVGDSVSDIQVARRTGARSIGYAKNPKRGTELEAAGADALVDTITELGEAIGASVTLSPLEASGSRSCPAELCSMGSSCLATLGRRRVSSLRCGPRRNNGVRQTRRW